MSVSQPTSGETGALVHRAPSSHCPHTLCCTTSLTCPPSTLLSLPPGWPVSHTGVRSESPPALSCFSLLGGFAWPARVLVKEQPRLMERDRRSGCVVEVSSQQLWPGTSRRQVQWVGQAQ